MSGQEGRLGVLRHVLSHLGVGTERADFDTAGRDGAVRVDLFIIGVAYMARVSFHTEEGSERCRSGATDHDGEERILEGLVRLLRHDVDTGQPAAVSRMGVVPSDNVFRASDLLAADIRISSTTRSCGGDDDDAPRGSSRCTES